MLTFSYIALAALGCGYIVVATVLGHLGELIGSHGGAGGSHATDSHYGVDGSGHGSASAGNAAAAAFHFPFFSPLALATLAAAVGGWGLIAEYGLKLEGTRSLVIALPAALATAWLVTWAAWKIVTGARGSSAIRLAELASASGEVITPIPEGGVGEVALLVGGQRFTAPAREAGGRGLPRGALVRVAQVAGATLVVSAVSPEQGGLSHG